MLLYAHPRGRGRLCPCQVLCRLLQAHAAKSKQDLTARETYDKPRMEDVVVVVPTKALIGKTFARWASCRARMGGLAAAASKPSWSCMPCVGLHDAAMPQS